MDKQLQESLSLLAEGIDSTNKLPTLVAQGWEATYRELFGDKIVDGMAPHHIEAVKWHWESRIAFLERRQPQYLAYFPIWSRGHMKSTLAESMTVIDAVLSVAYERPGFCLYLGREKSKVKENIANIETLISSERVQKWCPALSQVRRNEETNSKRQWTGTFLHTAANYIIKGGTVDSAMAGSRIEETRPTFIVPDDIDGREDSPIIAESRFNRLTTEILPMRQKDTLVFFAQNLISRYSVMYRIYTGQARVLTNRKPTAPIPAVEDLKTREVTVGGIVKDVYVSGTPTWDVWDEQRINDEIETMGLPAFLRECQHEVEQSREGLILHNFDDEVHTITESEFAAVYGSQDAYRQWSKWVIHDWARTKTDRHANVAGYITVSSQDSAAPGVVFIVHPLSFPPNSEPEDVGERLLSVLEPFAYSSVPWASIRKDTLRRENAAVYTDTLEEKIRYERAALARVLPKYARPVLSEWNVKGGFMSHDQDTVRDILNTVFCLNLQPANPRKTSAFEDMNAVMRVDYESEHIFKPGMKGYTRFAIIVPDEKADYPYATRPHDLHDHDLIRYQFNNWRFRPNVLTVTGEIIDEPEKSNDDFGQALQMFFYMQDIRNVPLMGEERVMVELEERFPRKLFEHRKSGLMKTNNQSAVADLITQRMLMRRQIADSVEEREKPPSPEWAGVG